MSIRTAYEQMNYFLLDIWISFIQTCIPLPHIKEEQTTQWPKDKRTHDLQNTTKKTKDWAIRIPPKPVNKLRCSGKVKTICDFVFDFPCTVLTITKSDGKLCPYGQHMSRWTISFLIFEYPSSRHVSPPPNKKQK
jgi:hypothetical protein